MSVRKAKKRRSRLPLAAAAVALALAAILADSRWRLELEDYELVSGHLPA